MKHPVDLQMEDCSSILVEVDKPALSGSGSGSPLLYGL